MKYYRKKDSRGWYVCYWTFNKKNIVNLARKTRLEKIEKLKEILEREETKDYFSCGNNCVKVDFDTAFKNNFKCPECGSLLKLQDNKKRIENIKKEIANLSLSIA